MASLWKETEQFILWMGERGKAPPSNSNIAQNMSERPLFPSAACFESKLRIAFKHSFNQAAVHLGGGGSAL